MTAELALLPDLVEQDTLVLANSVLQVSMLIAEGLGIIVLGPLLIKLFGVPAVGLVGAGLCLLATLLAATLPRGQATARPAEDHGSSWAKLNVDLQAGWRVIAHDRLLRLVVLQATVAATLLLLLVSLAPGLATRHLGLNVEDAPLLMLPGGLGFVVGSFLMSRWQGRRRQQDWIAAGLIGLGLCAGLLGLLSGVPERLWLAALLIWGIGLTLAPVIILARVTLQERPPPSMRGRVIATQLALANALAVLPLYVGGSLADYLGIGPVLSLLGLLTLAAGAAGLYYMRR
jgi:DHA3 family macrolide efflux protein-like MFS transporter